jgi:ubiquinone biosynthesis protein UbiJ
MAVRAASLGAGSAIEGAAYGLGQVVHEAALGDPNLTAESALATIGFSGALGAGLGGAGGVLAQGFREIGPSDVGAKLKSWLGEFEGERNVKAAGAIQSDIKRVVKQKGREGLQAIGREAGEMGLVGPLSTPASTLEKSQEVMQDAGRAMGTLLRGADASADAAAPKMTEVLDRLHSEVLAPMRSNPFQAPLADKLSETMAGYANRSGFQALHEIRRQVSDEIYGLRGQLDPEGTYKRSALRQVRRLLSDELNDSLDRAGGLSEEWKTLNRRYEVASTIAEFAEAGVNRAHGNNLVSPTEFLAGTIGAASHGPLGSLAGVATAAARRHASGLLGAVSGSARRALEAGTSDVIGAARQAGQDTLTAEATNRPETVAALSLLERMKQSVNNQIDDGVSTIVNAGPKAARVGRSEVAAGIAAIFGKSHEEASGIYSKRVSEIQKLAQNPQEFHATLERQTDDWHEHAPNTAFAVQTTSARAVSFLASKLPQHDRPGILAPKWVPTKSEVARFNRYYEAVQNPQSILKQASAGTLTPEALEAVRTVYPAMFTEIQAG